jgi:hypothetical protein
MKPIIPRDGIEPEIRYWRIHPKYRCAINIILLCGYFLALWQLFHEQNCKQTRIDLWECNLSNDPAMQNVPYLVITGT